jgi:hypothetical protein
MKLLNTCLVTAGYRKNSITPDAERNTFSSLERGRG